MSSNDQSLQDRLESLEVRISYQDCTIDQLNGVVTAMQAQVDSLKKELKGLTQQATSRLVSNDDTTKPPHY